MIRPGKSSSKQNTKKRRREKEEEKEKKTIEVRSTDPAAKPPREREIKRLDSIQGTINIQEWNGKTGIEAKCGR